MKLAEGKCYRLTRSLALIRLKRKRWGRAAFATHWTSPRFSVDVVMEAGGRADEWIAAGAIIRFSHWTASRTWATDHWFQLPNGPGFSITNCSLDELASVLNELDPADGRVEV